MTTDLGWDIIAQNRLKIGQSSHKGLDDPVVLGDCPRNRLGRVSEIFTAWCRMRLSRLHLLVPGSEGVQDRRVRVSNVVVSVFRDAAVPRFGIWKPDRVVESVLERTVKVMYTLAGSPRSTSPVLFDS